MSMQKLMKGLIEKKLQVRKGTNVQGCVRLHFPNQEIEDIIFTNNNPVDIFKWIGVTHAELKRSNLSALVQRGDLEIV